MPNINSKPNIELEQQLLNWWLEADNDTRNVIRNYVSTMSNLTTFQREKMWDRIMKQALKRGIKSNEKPKTVII
jgi:hypothetical protein